MKKTARIASIATCIAVAAGSAALLTACGETTTIEQKDIPTTYTVNTTPNPTDINVNLSGAYKPDAQATSFEGTYSFTSPETTSAEAGLYYKGSVLQVNQVIYTATETKPVTTYSYLGEATYNTLAKAQAAQSLDPTCHVTQKWSYSANNTTTEKTEIQVSSFIANKTLSSLTKEEIGGGAAIGGLDGLVQAGYLALGTGTVDGYGAKKTYTIGNVLGENKSDDTAWTAAGINDTTAGSKTVSDLFKQTAIGGTAGTGYIQVTIPAEEQTSASSNDLLGKLVSLGAITITQAHVVEKTVGGITTNISGKIISGNVTTDNREALVTLEILVKSTSSNKIISVLAPLTTTTTTIVLSEGYKITVTVAAPNTPVSVKTGAYVVTEEGLKIIGEAATVYDTITLTGGNAIIAKLSTTTTSIFTK